MKCTIAGTTEDVERVWSEVRAWVDADERRSLYAFERQLWTLLLAVGRALVALFLAREAGRPRSLRYEHGGRWYFLSGMCSSSLGTRFGKVAFSRPIGRPVGKCRGAADRPVDRDLGTCSGFSLGTVLATTRLCAQMAFHNARDTFKEFHEWSPSPRAVLRMVDAVGAKARPFLEQAPAPEDDGEILVIQVDGRGAPMICSTEKDRRCQPHHERKPNQTRRTGRRLRRQERPKRRRAKGDKSKNSKLAVVGVIYTLKVTAEGVEGPINKRLYATFESHEALFVWLRKEADKRGYGRKKTLFLADGSEHIWRCQEKYFPAAEVCLDWYHVVEKLWEAGACFLEESSPELKAWVADQTRRLRRGDVAPMLKGLREHLDRIPKTGPGNNGRRKRLEDICEYLENHRPRLRYRELRQRDFDIGTGAAEGAVRNLVGIRLDGPGMRWGRGRSERVLHLRCVLLNGQWPAFADHLGDRGNVRLLAQPIPAAAHEAKRERLLSRVTSRYH